MFIELQVQHKQNYNFSRCSVHQIVFAFEIENDLMYTTCFLLLNLQFNKQSVVIFWVNWCKKECFWQKITCIDIEKIPESEPGDKAPTAGLLSKQAVPVHVERKLFDTYYNGCCNETFWPLFHSMPDRAIFRDDTWAVRLSFF